MKQHTTGYPPGQTSAIHNGHQPPLHQTVDEIARWYAETLGWLAVPARGKEPLGGWGEDHIPALNLDKLTARWKIAQERYRRYGGITNVALLLGRRSGLVVADIDPRHGGRLETLWKLGWPRDTVTARSGGGGWHVYCACPAGGLPSIPRYAQGVEFKGNGAVIIAPPSIHPTTGQRYGWLRGHAPWQSALAPLPPAIAGDVRARRATAHPRLASVARDDEDTPPPLAYPPARTVELVTTLLNWAIRETRPDYHGREHRNNMAYRLGQQLGSLGLSTREIAAVAALYEQAVRNEQ